MSEPFKKAPWKSANAGPQLDYQRVKHHQITGWHRPPQNYRPPVKPLIRIYPPDGKARAYQPASRLIVRHGRREEKSMITHDPLITPSELQARVKSQPMPSREELMKRNSFGSVNNNKYLNRWLGSKK